MLNVASEMVSRASGGVRMRVLSCPIGVMLMRQELKATWRSQGYARLRRGRSGNRDIGYVSTPGYFEPVDTFRDVTRQSLDTQIAALDANCKKILRRIAVAANQGNGERVKILTDLLERQQSRGLRLVEML